MKKIYCLLTFLFLSSMLFAQPWLENLPKNKSKVELTFFDYQKAFDDYWKPFNVSNDGFYYQDSIKKKAYGWKQFKRWEYEMEGQINPSTGEFPKQTAQEVYNEYIKKNPQLKSLNSSSWTSLGPYSKSGVFSGVGRINCIAFHPTDNNTYWVGAASGGLWVTTNNGTTWTCLTDNTGVLAISDIVIPTDYASSNTIYIATGDKDAWDNRSIGVLKSTNGGSTWNATGISYAISDNKMVYRLLIDPNNNQTLLAATYDGVYKTTNGGTTWNTCLTTLWFRDMEYKPGDFNTLYGAYLYERIYCSVNGGISWTQAFSNTNAARIELAVSSVQPTWIYAIATPNSGELEGIYKSENSGMSFSKIYDGTISCHNLLAYDVCQTGGQGWYDLAIAVSPSNANNLVIGGINTWRSTNGGISWLLINEWGNDVPVVHPDKHYLSYRTNGDLFECNDGGVFLSSDNGTSWIDKTSGMSISQMYKLGVTTTVTNEIITGLQDNGTKLISSGSWADVTGGDGTECLIDYSDINIQYAAAQNGVLSRTTDHWVNQIFITPSGAGYGAWVTPFIIDPTNDQILYAGYADVWKTTNRGDSWTQISTMTASTYRLRSMAIAPSNNQILYVATLNQIRKTSNGGISWIDITGNLPVQIYDNSENITAIAVKNDDANTLWVTLSYYTPNKVYQSTNGGASWTDISAGLPSIPVYSIVQNKLSTAEVQLYVGTELGVYFKEGADNWIAFNSGLPNVKIGEIEIYYAPSALESKLRAATYGRGLWESTVNDFLSNGIEIVANDKSVKVYPNPVTNELMIEIEGNNKVFSFEILNAIGQMVFKGKVVDKTIIQTTNLAPGVYLLKLENGKSFEFKKILKE